MALVLSGQVEVQPHDWKRLPDLRGNDAALRRLTEYLRGAWPSDVTVGGLRRAEGGFSNETWFIDLVEGSRTTTVVMRRQAMVGPLEPYDLQRESTILRGLGEASTLRVPQVYLYCGDSDVLGSPFTLIERLAGLVPDYRTLPEYPPWHDKHNRTLMAYEVVRTLDAIQRTPTSTGLLSTILVPGRSGRAPVLDRVDALRQRLDERVGPANVLPALRDCAAWLTANVPDLADGAVLVHGDFRVGNFLWEGTTITGVLDWEGAGLGDAFEDLGYLCHPMARRRDPSLMGMLVSIDELAEIVRDVTGRDVDFARLHYYLIYALYFHLWTLVSGLAAVMDGADMRVGLGYSKYGRVTRELMDQMTRYEKGDHVL
jgi:aminoglycoside phosphotransferase (APT) family kinase protein